MTEDAKKNSRVREPIHTEEINITLDENKLTIPEEVIERFKEAGYSLRWVRYRVGEKEDYANVAARQRHGWRFVTAEEVPEMMISTQNINFGRYNGLVTVEDVALAKCANKHIKEVKKLLEQKARRQLEAEEAKLLKNSDSRTMKSRVTRGGKKPSFDDGDES